MSEWKDSMSVDEKLEADPKWYYVPPYSGEGHTVVDSAGQHVAVFEIKELALIAVESHNKYIEEL